MTVPVVASSFLRPQRFVLTEPAAPWLVTWAWTLQQLRLLTFTFVTNSAFSPIHPRDLLCAIYFLCQDSIAAYFSQIRGGIGQLYCSSYICPRRPASLFGADNCIFFKYVCRQQADDSLLSCCNIQSSSFRTGLNVCRLDIQAKRRRWTPYVRTWAAVTSCSINYHIEWILVSCCFTQNQLIPQTKIFKGLHTSAVFRCDERWSATDRAANQNLCHFILLTHQQIFNMTYHLS